MKVGDKVVVVNDSIIDGEGFIGDIGYIREIRKYDEFPIKVDIEDYGMSSFKEEELKVIK